MPDLNKVQLMGNLTSDPELRRIQSGTAVTELRMAVNHTWIGKDGEKREDKAYIDVTVWGSGAEFMCQAGRKGSLVFVEGRLKMDSWNDKTTGEKRTKLKVEAERAQLLDSRRDASEGDRHDDYPQPQASRGRQQETQPPSQQQGRGGAPQSRGGGYAGRGPSNHVTQAEVDHPDDDIPFARPIEFDSNEFFEDAIPGCVRF